MTEPSPDARLFSDFEPLTAQAWKTRIVAELKGADYEKTLCRLTEEGIRIEPFYTADSLTGISARPLSRAAQGWLYCPRLFLASPAEIKTLLQSLLPGADALCLVLPDGDNSQLEAVLAELPLRELPILLQIDAHPLPALAALRLAAERQGLPLAELKGALEYDPLSGLGAGGSYNEAEIAELAAFRQEAPGFRTLTVNGASFHNRGGTATQELAFTLSAAVEYLHRLTDDGASLPELLSGFTLRMAAGTDYFLEIAKLRALRLLWQAIVQEFGEAGSLATQLLIRTETSTWHQTLLDPHTNLLRATTQAMAAVLGGTDLLTVLPFDAVSQPEGSGFSQRLARNISLILKEEAYLHQTADPAAGAYFLENLTQELAAQSWELFRELESRGGFLRGIRSGFVHDQLEASRLHKLKAVATRQQVMVGVNQFQNPKSELPATGSASPAGLRAASAFEQLKLSGVQPAKGKIQLALLGSSPALKAKAGFAAELFGLGGFPTYRQAYTDPAELPAKLFSEPDAAVVVCAADAELPAWLPAINGLFEGRPSAPLLFVAAPESAFPDSDRLLNLTGFVHQSTNVPEFLTELQQQLALN